MNPALKFLKIFSKASLPPAALLLAAAAILGGCSLAPKYTRPAVETPAAFKESAGATNLWQVAQPNDSARRGQWWAMFNDPQLNALEDQVTISNQNVAAAFANFMSARALVREARSQYFPTLVANPQVTRSRQSANGQKNFTGSSTVNEYSLPLDASWQPDLWGRVRNTVRANAAAAQASAADLENTRLTAQGELASDYFQLRAQDSLIQLFNDTVQAYSNSFALTRVLFQTGIDSDQDVAQAETQLETARAQDTNLGILRAQLEHAIAMLTGRAASAFSIPVAPLSAGPPLLPVGLPSQLLERRPDIAAAERQMVGANAQIGVAKAAYYPTITLSASGGFESTAVENLLDWPNRFWSIGAGLSETILDFGARGATVAQYRAAYDNAVAQYRQTVLAAFQQVEDELAALRIIEREIPQQEAAVNASARYLQLAQSRYKLGIDSYLNVITAQTTLLANRQTLVNLRTQQMTAAVQLVEALGGGWDQSQLPKP
jgi:NodT family efflux transporter outer membrane factor (OMF) lipoprotein